MLNRSSILNISVLCLWNSAGGRCLKLIELKTAIDHLERHLNIAKELEDIFEENKRGFGGKSCTFLFRRIWRTYSRQVSRKTVAKSLADGVVQLAIPGVYIMRISYDWATVNSFVFIEQRSISFQNDISLKNHEIGSPVVRKVKIPWDSQQNRELGPAWGSKSNYWSFRHVYRLDESKSFKCL